MGATSKNPDLDSGLHLSLSDCRNVANNTGTSTLDPHSKFGAIYAFAVNFVFSRRRFLSVILKTGSTDSWTGVALWIQLNYHQETYFHQNEFLASISFFLVIMAANINVDAIALDAKLACGVPWNIRHEEGTPCKFWGKDESGTHVHDGTCKKRDGFHLIHSLECTTTSVDLEEVVTIQREIKGKEQLGIHQCGSMGVEAKAWIPGPGQLFLNLSSSSTSDTSSYVELEVTGTSEVESREQEENAEDEEDSVNVLERFKLLVTVPGSFFKMSEGVFPERSRQEGGPEEGYKNLERIAESPKL
ncbi:hypothetical protein DFJ43DRAFT_1035236 [Lentinula guzmanii]|uniref:Uncharacterized protein n=1 Tax=Lentinula guzmanii TaxID=2804957 RepID=A0AA38JRW2_9AGAR|nr:hypothetical protein DFJ43DRAFT_1035236 [Lentinula guzmanii]